MLILTFTITKKNIPDVYTYMHIYIYNIGGYGVKFSTISRISVGLRPK